jgi:hypothetical protein
MLILFGGNYINNKLRAYIFKALKMNTAMTCIQQYRRMGKAWEK